MAKRKVGRPQKLEGAGSVNISVRINETLLARLRDAATQSGHGNLSREISHRLWLSFSDDQKLDPPTKAFGFLISELAKVVHFNRPNWQRDPYFFRAFRLAVSRLLEAFEPKGKIRTPRFLKMLDELTGDGHALSSWHKQMAKSPESLAKAAVDLTLFGYRSPEPFDKGVAELSELTDATLPPDLPKFGTGPRDAARNAYYGMQDARRVLAVTKPGKSSPKKS